MIEINKLSKKFGTKEVLKNISLTFSKGKVYGIVGRNGAGKTTLFNCISGLEKFEGDIVSDFNQLKSHIGFLGTNPIIMSRITGWEYLKLLCVARSVERNDFEDQNLFDLPLKQYAETYSTGMKKKLALTAILLQRNEIFILDEPFNGVDIQSNMMIVDLILELKKRDKTIVVSSHIFSTLTEICDNIILIEDGEISKVVGPEKFTELRDEMKSFIKPEKILKFDVY